MKALSTRPMDCVTDVIVDVSALSVGTSFPIIRYFFERAVSDRGPPNLHLFVTHDPSLDGGIRSISGDSPGYIHGFRGNSTLSGAADSARLWLPQLSSGRRQALERLYEIRRAPRHLPDPSVSRPPTASRRHPGRRIHHGVRRRVVRGHAKHHVRRTREIPWTCTAPSLDWATSVSRCLPSPVARCLSSLPSAARSWPWARSWLHWSATTSRPHRTDRVSDRRLIASYHRPPRYHPCLVGRRRLSITPPTLDTAESPFQHDDRDQTQGIRHRPNRLGPRNRTSRRGPHSSLGRRHLRKTSCRFSLFWAGTPIPSLE